MEAKDNEVHWQVWTLVMQTSFNHYIFSKNWRDTDNQFLCILVAFMYIRCFCDNHRIFAISVTDLKALDIDHGEPFILRYTE